MPDKNPKQSFNDASDELKKISHENFAVKPGQVARICDAQLAKVENNKSSSKEEGPEAPSTLGNN
jgi:predicted RecB family nuclease